MPEKEKEETEGQVEPEVEQEEKQEEKPKEKPKEKKVRKVKKKRKGVFAYYKIGEDGLERLRPLCERCGPGYFMADHGDRYTCGHCGFTQYRRSEASK